MRRLKGFVALILAVSFVAHASVTVTVNGTNHSIPQTNERGWGNAVTAWIQAISTYTLQPTGGVFTLSADADFGGSYGLKTSYLSTRTANPSSSGLLRLAKTDTIGFRNNANSADLSIGIDGSNNLTFNSVAIPTISSTSTLTNKSIDAASNTISNISNSEIKAAAAIALNKLAATTASRALTSDASGFVSASSVTSTELGYVSGVTSAIQTQIDGKQATGNYITALTGDVTASGPGSVAATIGAGKVTNAMLAGSIDLTSKVTGALPAANGGTGQSSYTKGDLLVASAATTLSKLGVGADGTVLTADSAQTTGVKWGTALTNPMTTSGDIIYGGASGTPTRLAKGTDGQILTLASGVPTWATQSAYAAKSAGYTATTTDNTILFTASATLALPAASTVTGKIYEVVSSGSSTVVTIDPNGAETVCGQTTVKLLGAGDGMTIQSDGTNWIGLRGGCEHDKRAIINPISNASCTITSQSGTWITAQTPTAAGDCTLTMSGFSATPACDITPLRNDGNRAHAWINTISSTSLRFQESDSAGTLGNYQAYLICRGPR